jgi:hypothetical protein
MARLTAKCMTTRLNNHHVPSWFFIFGGESLGMVNCIDSKKQCKMYILSTCLGRRRFFSVFPIIHKLRSGSKARRPQDNIKKLYFGKSRC